MLSNMLSYNHNSIYFPSIFSGIFPWMNIFFLSPFSHPRHFSNGLSVINNIIPVCYKELWDVNLLLSLP